MSLTLTQIKLLPVRRDKQILTTSVNGSWSSGGNGFSNSNDNNQYAPLVHALVDPTKHTVTGLTPGDFLKALTATTYGFATHGLTYTDVGAAAINQSFYFGTTLIAINRASALLAVAGISSIDIEDGGSIASGDVSVVFDDTNNFLEVTGCTVGIGTTDPAGYTLNVNGTLLAATSITTPTIKLTSGATNGYLWQCNNADGSGAWVSITTSQVYNGAWEANINTPELVDGVGTSGDYYHVVVAGTTEFSIGNTVTFVLGDDVWYNGSIWQKITGATYIIQTATSSILGGIKVGGSLQINSDVLNVNNYDFGDITVTGSGANVGRIWTIDAGVVTLAKMAPMATASLIYRKSTGSGNPEVNSLATLKTDLGLTGTNSGDNSVNSSYSSLVSFPGFGTTHTTAAYGDHTHSSSTMILANTYNTGCYVILAEGATGALSLKTNAGLQYNAYTREFRINGDVYATDFCRTTSDETLKTNIESVIKIETGIEYKKFFYKDDLNQIHYGPIAQQVQIKNPELVFKNERGILGIRSTDIIFYELASLKERVRQLENKLN